MYIINVIMHKSNASRSKACTSFMRPKRSLLCWLDSRYCSDAAGTRICMGCRWGSNNTLMRRMDLQSMGNRPRHRHRWPPTRPKRAGSSWCEGFCVLMVLMGARTRSEYQAKPRSSVFIGVCRCKRLYRFRIQTSQYRSSIGNKL